MAEYNRFVSYMYVYENNQKTLNNGFVRVETRDGQCFVYIHMKDLYGGPKTVFSVYMVWRQDQQLKGINLGQIGRNGNQGEFYHETQKDDIENSGIPLEDMAGIVVVSDQGQKYGTCWDDEVFDMRSFREDEMVPVRRGDVSVESGLADFAEKKKVDSIESEETEVTSTESEEKESKGVDFEKADVVETKVAPAPRFITVPASEVEEVSEVEDSSEVSGVDDSSESSEAEDSNESSQQVHSESLSFAADFPAMEEAVFTSVPLMNRTPVKKLTLEEKLDKIISQGMNMFPFEDDEVDECVRMELQDIGMLPMKFWSYVGNSFLLQSYYSYRHLILGKFNNGNFFLGAPGLGQNKDKFMAQLFGFSNFKPIRSDEKGQSDFGYWYTVLK